MKTLIDSLRLEALGLRMLKEEIEHLKKRIKKAEITYQKRWNKQAKKCEYYPANEGGCNNPENRTLFSFCTPEDCPLIKGE